METPSAKDAMAFGKETLHLVKIDSLWQKGYCLQQKGQYTWQKWQSLW